MHLSLSILLIMLGVGSIYGAIKRHLFIKQVLDEGEQTTATIVDILKTEDYDVEHGRSYSYYPTYEYIDVDKLICKFTPNETTDLEKYTIGDQVSIVYKPGVEESVIVLTRFGRFGHVFFLSLLGIFWLAYGLYFFSTTSLGEKWI